MKIAAGILLRTIEEKTLPASRIIEALYNENYDLIVDHCGLIFTKLTNIGNVFEASSVCNKKYSIINMKIHIFLSEIKKIVAVLISIFIRFRSFC